MKKIDCNENICIIYTLSRVNASFQPPKYQLSFFPCTFYEIVSLSQATLPSPNPFSPSPWGGGSHGPKVRVGGEKMHKWGFDSESKWINDPKLGQWESPGFNWNHPVPANRISFKDGMFQTCTVPCDNHLQLEAAIPPSFSLVESWVGMAQGSPNQPSKASWVAPSVNTGAQGGAWRGQLSSYLHF